MQLLKIASLAFILLLCLTTQAQITTADVPTTTSSTASDLTGSEVPNAKRIRRHISLIIGVEHDEEFLIPDKEITIGGRTDFFDIKRIKDTDFFRISPRRAGSGITTLKDKKTGHRQQWQEQLGAAQYLAQIIKNVARTNLHKQQL